MTKHPELMTLSVEDIPYETTVTRRFLKRSRFVPRDPRMVAAVIPGIIRSLPIAAGQHIRRGQPMLVLEAMKMENSLLAPVDGRVKAVHVSEGEMVSKGKLLVELE
jgi:pyruvate carboxylase